MDDGLDDLFGDVPQLDIPAPLPSGLLQRLDELSLNGCCQKLTWSKNGCIAYVGPDGRNVILRHLLCDPNDGQWRLSKEYHVEEVSIAHNYHEIAHLSWSHTGGEIAVVDVFGQISILNVFLATNRLNVIRRCSPDPEDNLSAIVGMMWAYVDKWGYYHQPMQKTGAGDWVFTCSQRKLLGFQTPTPRPALLMLTRNGVIRILCQGQDIRLPWQDFRTELEVITSSADLLTHAAMCPDKIAVADKSTLEQDNAVLIATYNADRVLRIHRVKIDLERSRFDIHHVKVITGCHPETDSNDDSFEQTDAAVASHTQLSILDMIPPGPKSGTKEVTSPFIFAAFAKLSEGYAGATSQTSSSTIFCKWELQVAPPRLHPNFGSLSTKKTAPSSHVELPADYALKRSNDILTPKTLIGLHQVNMSTILVMMYSDASVEYRDRLSLELLPQNARDKFSILGQVGLRPSLIRPCLHTTISPNLCSVVCLDEQHVASLDNMQLSNDEFSSEDATFLEVINGAFVLQSSLAAMNVTYYDDLFATLNAFVNQHLYNLSDQESMPESFRCRFMSEVYRILGIQYDYSMDTQPQSIIQNTMLQKCLSIQASLGYAGAGSRAPLPSQVARITLDLRYMAWVLLVCSRTRPTIEDTVRFMTGLVAWLLALFAFIVDETITIAKEFQDKERYIDSLDLKRLNEHIHSTNSCALTLLLVSSSRSLLRVNCSHLRHLKNQAKTQQGPEGPGLAYSELDAVFSQSLVTVAQFESLLMQYDNSIKATYQTAGIHHDDQDKEKYKREKEERNSIEKDLLTKAIIPPILTDPVKTLLTTTINTLREEINEAELYFLDVGWLGLVDDRNSKRWRKKHPMDYMRKTELKKGARMKRCVRCGNLTEDIKPFRGSNVAVLQLQKSCICGGLFMVVGDEVDGTDGSGV